MASDERKQMEFRMDFDIKVVSLDEENQTFTGILVPNPQRYEEKTLGGQEGYYDRYTDIFIPKDVLFANASQMVGMPIHYSAPTVKDTIEYATKRRAAIISELNSGKYLLPEEAASAHRKLATARATFVSIDVVSSTPLRALHGVKFDRALGLLLRETATVVGQFQGAVLKMTGDGLIAFFDNESLNTQCDLAANFCTSLPLFLAIGLEPALASSALPNLRVRIGADYGDVAVEKVTVPATGFEDEEVRSDALNRAVKIQEIAKIGEAWIGKAMYDQLHTQYLERCVRVDGGTVNGALPGYEVYSLR